LFFHQPTRTVMQLVAYSMLYTLLHAWDHIYTNFKWRAYLFKESLARSIYDEHKVATTNSVFVFSCVISSGVSPYKWVTHALIFSRHECITPRAPICLTARQVRVCQRCKNCKPLTGMVECPVCNNGIRCLYHCKNRRWRRRSW